jgi:hypothetical protein
VAQSFNATTFFDAVRQAPFDGILSQEQVNGMTYILRAWKYKYGYDKGDRRWLAYMLATTFHETAYTMMPIMEYGSQSYLQGKDYYPYIGRGFVMLTWLSNYERGSGIVDEDLVHYPDLAMRPDIAAILMDDGMTNGWFTGVKLTDYFNDSEDDPVNARRIINGTDRAEEIALYHDDFLDAIMGALS